MLANYNNVMRKVSKKNCRKFEINFRKIAIKLLKKNVNPNVYGKYLFATFIIHYLLLRTENILQRYLWLQMWKYTVASPSYRYNQRFISNQSRAQFVMGEWKNITKTKKKHSVLHLHFFFFIISFSSLGRATITRVGTSAIILKKVAAFEKI